MGLSELLAGWFPPSRESYESFVWVWQLAMPAVRPLSSPSLHLQSLFYSNSQCSKPRWMVNKSHPYTYPYPHFSHPKPILSRLHLPVRILLLGSAANHQKARKFAVAHRLVWHGKDVRSEPPKHPRPDCVVHHGGSGLLDAGIHYEDDAGGARGRGPTLAEQGPSGPLCTSHPGTLRDFRTDVTSSFTTLTAPSSSPTSSPPCPQSTP